MIITLKEQDVIQRFPNFNATILKNITKESPILNSPGYYIAGGACVNSLLGLNYVNDIDVFMKDMVYHNKLHADFKDKYSKPMPPPTTSTSASYAIAVEYSTDHGKIQTLTPFYLDWESLFDKFDMTCCQVGFRSNEWIFTEQSLIDLETRILRLHCFKYSEKLMIRFFKYLGKGFMPTPEALKFIVDNGTST